MLTVAKITSSAAVGYADYLEGRSQSSALGDYYLKDGDRVEAPGRWSSGASTVGMTPTAVVTGEQLRTLMQVRRPDNGQPLRRAGATGQVAALDATFSAPKSVSAVWAVAGAELRGRIEAAHEQAIDRAIAYSVREVAMIRVRDQGVVVHVRAAEVIATSWRHTTARAVPGQAPDPQLHSHVLLHGAVRRDGRVVAIDSRRWLQHSRELGAAYRTELARGMRELGFQITRGTGRAGRYFEIDGVPAGLLDRWSSRHHQVRAAIDSQLQRHEQALQVRAQAAGADGDRAAAQLKRLRGSGRLTPAQDRQAAISTRSAKQPLATGHDLDRTWAAVAAEHGLAPQVLLTIQAPTRTPLAPGDDLAQRLTEFDARFTAREARAVALEASAGVSIEEAVGALSEMRRDGSLLKLTDATFTTHQQRATEQATITAAGTLARGRVAPITAGRAEQEIERLDAQLRRESHTMTEEQADAIRLACSDRQLVVLEGQAGSGKSTVLSAVARAHQAEGRQIIVTSTAALAAHRLAGEMHQHGVDCQAYSTAALHTALASGRVGLNHRTTVIHDEAALASTREQHQLLTASAQGGARVIAVGDPAQSRPVGAGGLWSDIQDAAEASQARAVLTRNVRARFVLDRHDQRLFREGHIELALSGYERRGGLRLTQTADEAEQEAVWAAHCERGTGRDSLVIAQTSNEHLDALNAYAQALRVRNGEVTGPGIAVARRPYLLHHGDLVQIRRTLQHPDRDQPLRNGTTAKVAGVDADHDRAWIALDGDTDRVELTGRQLAQADVRLAYVQHPFPAQGATSDQTHLIIGEHATREGSYVGLTRARDTTTIHAAIPAPEEDEPNPTRGPLTRLAERMSRTEPDVPSVHIPLAHEDATAHQPDTTPPGERHSGPVIAALGPRPAPEAATRAVWDAGAEAITTYRGRYQIPAEDPRPLGPQPPADAFTQRREHRNANDTVTRAARSLGLDADEPSPDHLQHLTITDHGYEP